MSSTVAPGSACARALAAASAVMPPPNTAIWRSGSAIGADRRVAPCQFGGMIGRCGNALGDPAPQAVERAGEPIGRRDRRTRIPAFGHDALADEHRDPA